MKKIAYLILLSLSISACKKDFYKQDLGTDIYLSALNYKNIQGKWNLNSVVQTDEKSLIKESLTITDFFDNSSKPNISFSINGTDTTFSVDTAGLLINYFGDISGKWSFDNSEFPKNINLTTSKGNQVVLPISSNLISSALPSLISFKQTLACPDPDDPTKTVNTMSFSINLTK